MKSRPGSRALVSLTLAAIAIIATAVLSYRTIDDLAAGVERGAQSQTLLGTIDRLVLDLTDAEASQRAYVLSGEQRYLDDYRAATGRLDRGIADARVLPGLSPEHRAGFDTIVSLTAARQADLGRPVERRQAGDSQGAIAALSGASSVLSEDIRRRAVELRTDEETVLAQQSAASLATSRWAPVAITGGGGLALLLAIVGARALAQTAAKPQPALGLREHTSHASTDLAPLASDAVSVPASSSLPPPTEPDAESDRARAARRELEAALAGIFSAAADAIVTIDSDHRVMMFNRAAEQMFGVVAADVLGTPLTRFLPLPLTVPDADRDRRLAETGVDGWRLGETAPLTAVRSGGAEIPVEATVTPVTVRGQQLFTAVIRDASTRVQMEQLHREVNARLEQALADVQQTQTVMLRQERLKALGQLASGIAHDFNNALSMIVGFTELLLSDAELDRMDEKMRTHLQLIHSAAQDAAGVVGRLREFSLPRGANDSLSPVQINDLVAQAISLSQPRWRDQAQAGGHTIRVSAELGQVPLIGGQASELREALTNLIINAVDAMPDGGTLTLRTRETDEMVQVEVADTGTGMPPDVREHIFDPFYTTKGDRGTGLGLPMVQGIVEHHAGEIRVESLQGQGTTFIMRFRPLPGETEAASDAVKAAPPRVRGLRVLLTEDEPSLRHILTSYLRVDGHTIETAGNGHEALAKYQPNLFDLVITDRAMPEMGGDALAAELARRGSMTPVIMLTGLGDLMNEVGERPTGVDLVVAKPVTLADLRAAVVLVTSD